MKLLSVKHSNRNSIFDHKHAHQPNAGGHSSWAVSYVDLLTLLLCFFVIFYNNQPKAPPPPKVKILKSIASALPSGMTAVPSIDPGIYEVEIADLSFFNSGSTELLPEAKEKLAVLIEHLKSNKDHLHITVQGHADQQQVSAKRHKFTDNWELSVLRATSVLKLFVGDGFPQETLSAEGFSSTRALASDSSLSNQRRVTLRIEEK